MLAGYAAWQARISRPTVWLIVLVTALFAFLPWWTDDVPMRESLLLAAVYITLGHQPEHDVGYAGYVNFGNIVFFGLGGYICVYLVNDWHWPLLLAALVGGVCVSAFAHAVRLRHSAAARRLLRALDHRHQRSGRAFVANFEPWGGATGIYLALEAYEPLGGPDAGAVDRLFPDRRRDGPSLLLSYVIKSSKFGLGLLAIGQNEDAAAILGVNTRRYKALIYSISAFLPAVAGGLYFFKSGIIEPNGAFNLTQSIEAIVMVMLGGHGTVIGPALGAFLYEELRGAPAHVGIVLALSARHRRRAVARRSCCSCLADCWVGCTSAFRAPARCSNEPRAAMNAVLEVTALSKRFGGLEAVSNLTFKVEEGEIFGLIGPNGAGKSTVFNLINGVYPPGLRPHRVSTATTSPARSPTAWRGAGSRARIRSCSRSRT